MDLKESALIGDDPSGHWYYGSKAEAMMRCLEGQPVNRVLDVGAGSGFFSRHLLTHGSARSALCVDTGYTADRDEVVDGKALYFRRAIDRSDADLVLLMDVLEHVDDDVALVASCVAGASAGARVFVTVPAHQWLWSAHDVFLEHRRRYSLSQLEATMTGAGLRVLDIHYYFASVLPIAAISSPIRMPAR